MGEFSLTNDIGFAAAGLVFATFCMRSMNALRWVAIASNVAFIAYGYLGSLAPVLLLHALLLPVNLYQLAYLRSARRSPAGTTYKPARRLRKSLFSGGPLRRRRCWPPRQTGGSYA